MRRSLVRKVSYQGVLGIGNGQVVRILITELKSRAMMNFRSNKALRNDHC
jgi:ribose 5-phosphate isomerase